jgi:hypothetical protein
MKFDRPDPEYLDGELVERHLGDTIHSATQRKLILALQHLESHACHMARCMCTAPKPMPA